MLLALLALLAAACDDGESKDCSEGGDGCPCTADGACDDGLVCDGGTCRETCTPGNEFCACIDGTMCNLDGDGRQLACSAEGVCVSPECAPGELGCDCNEGACSDGYVCSTDSGIERCEIADCTIGDVGCGCPLDRKCATGSVCVAGMCTDVDCAIGEAGCACSSNYTCKSSQLWCDYSSDACVVNDSDCTAGNLGCDCLEDERCVGNFICMEGACQDPDCPPGTEGCGCFLDDSGMSTCGQTASGEQLTCTSGICGSGSCPPGDPGCACVNQTPEGDSPTMGCNAEDSICVDGYCKGGSCIPGSAGCDCLAGSCDPGLTCQNNSVCVDNTGRTGGPCHADKTCDRNNRCDQSASTPICQWCDLGTQGCQCLDAATEEGGALCNAGLTCLGRVEEADGTVSINGHCVGDETVFSRSVPDNPVCYSPCEESFTDTAGVFHECDADGQMLGCFGAKICSVDLGMPGAECLDPGDACDTTATTDPCADSGLTCVEPGFCSGGTCSTDDDCDDGLTCHDGECRDLADVIDLPDICVKDGDCPGFQQCIQGYCYAECAADEECDVANGEACASKVCRKTCSLNASSCQTGYLCEAADGETGYCMPAATSGTPQVLPEGRFSVSVDTIRLSNVAPEATFTLTNNSDDYLTFTVTKQEHYAAFDGSTEVESIRLITQDPEDELSCAFNEYSGPNCPMWWMQMGTTSGSMTTDTSIEVKVPPNCGDDASDPCPTVAIEFAQFPDAKRWSGTLRVASTVGTKDIIVTYAERPEGQWGGKIVYFANFDTRGIDDDGVNGGWLTRSRSNIDGTGTNELAVPNALLRRWVAFRSGDLQDGWPEFKAVLNATETGQWDFPSVKSACTDQTGACYLYVDPNGNDVGSLPRSYVSSLSDYPIPTGATEFAFAMNLYDDNYADTNYEMVGRVESSVALHYPGNPAVSLRFEEDPTKVETATSFGEETFMHFLDVATTDAAREAGDDGLSLEAIVGGRYPAPEDGSGCETGFTRVDQPWLVPGFLEDAWVDSSSGLYRRSWCVDARLPAYETDEMGNLTTEIDDQVANRSLARANPVPDGKYLRRRIELLDGAMINQEVLFVLFRERYPSFLGGDDLVAYGYMWLERNQEALEREDVDGNGTPDAYDGNEPPSDTELGVTDTGESVACSQALLDEVLGAGYQLPAPITSSTTILGATDQADINDLISALIDGGMDNTPLTIPTGDQYGCTSSATEEVHYVCESTGLFNGGPDNTACWGAGSQGPNDDSCAQVYLDNGVCDDGGVGSSTSNCSLGTDATDCGYRYQDVRIECPLTSRVVFFTAPASMHDTIVNHPCQDTVQTEDGEFFGGECLDQLMLWFDNGTIIEQFEPTWTCDNGSSSCDDNPRDRRAGKTFYEAGSTGPQLTSLRPEMEDAFRYKTQFVNREGTSLGFTPQICVPFSSSTPYCYNPARIELVRERVDCLLRIYEDYYSHPQYGLTNSTLFSYLDENFAVRTEPNIGVGGLPSTYDGFERLNAELLIMLGDDAYTSAFESRFDLAGINAAGFEGDKFEVDGLAVSGIAGYEIYKLHQAVQYYSMTLDRFYRMSSVISASIGSASASAARNFVTPATVTSYFDRLIRASTQRSRAWSEIARRYKGFNRPDLARRVASRAYTQTYLESVALASVLLEVYDGANGTQKPQLLVELEKAQRRYRMALLDLKVVYEGITDETTIFGYPPDYIPFPALPPNTGVETTGFDTVLNIAINKMELAKSREQIALEKTRAFDTDEASFQAELTRISRTYEGQLGEICGIFTAPDGNVYPAIERYAYLSPELEIYGDPCGFAGNGQIHNMLTQLSIDRVEIQRVMTAMSNTVERIMIEKERVEDTCDLKLEIADFQYDVAQEQRTLDRDMGRIEMGQRLAQRTFQMVDTIINLVNCNGTECASAGVAVGASIANATAEQASIVGFHFAIEELQDEKAKLERDSARWVAEKDCEFLDIDLNATTATLLLDVRDQELSMRNAHYRLALNLSELSKLRQQAKRIQLEMEEAVDLSINVEVAKNDPNIRIYRNDAVINAEVAFEDALQEAYRLTLVYQYYTSQSYAPLEQLFLTRMVSAGDYNLENYIYELRNAFTSFLEEYGYPDQRVLLVSLRDDILRIPRTDDNGDPLGIDARATMMREQLRDTKFLNSKGYVTLPFATRLADLSPPTRNHKILFIEANIEGNDNGDYLGRLYLRQLGTSTISTVDGDLDFYRFPDRMAVMDPFFNSTREFANSPEIYKNYRLRDRPLVNNHYDLIINQRDEVENQDINLNALTDIKLFIHYSDFTDDSFLD